MELLVLDIPSTLHPSREELVQLPGFAGLDVPLLLVLEEGGQLRDLPHWSCQESAPQGISWQSSGSSGRLVISSGQQQGPRAINIANVV